MGVISLIYCSPILHLRIHPGKYGLGPLECRLKIVHDARHGDRRGLAPRLALPNLIQDEAHANAK